jgi:hypothetical protein
LSAGGKTCLATSRDNLDKLYRDASNSLTILERSHRFTMEDLDNHRYKLQESLDDMIRLRQLVSRKDTIIKDLRASKRLVKVPFDPGTGSGCRLEGGGE